MKCDVISLENKKVGDIDLDESVFGVDVRADLLHRMVNWQLAKRQAGTRKTKTRSEISGTTAKPFKQKGSGNARQGTKRAPHMRGGGKAFGPVVRDHGYSLPKKVRRLALKTALSSKQAGGRLIVVDSIGIKDAKTSELAKKIKGLGWGTALIIDGPEVNAEFARAARNIVGVDVLPQQGANVYDILRRDTLVLTKDAVEKLVERLK
ncbi:MAG: 50S ribosomal protein L4 [Rhodospirillales bacterium]|nr:50S ribosomal protein L4 [Rhodospirillales bacterium]MCW8863007.1 50S ribosomal protein L4 [Rhodospirillales bacterium]MCW8951808.1 50S ribosomal protein L4 [Rhodospirillales bacterium]MCW8971115.1 50S ribosomal protein L4 [Rhodospirillales bacterium]MCW9002221.1 50S ribosomal protein L4 [Rhodospirillales bacterium]